MMWLFDKLLIFTTYCDSYWRLRARINGAAHLPFQQVSSGGCRKDKARAFIY